MQTSAAQLLFIFSIHPLTEYWTDISISRYYSIAELVVKNIIPIALLSYKLSVQGAMQTLKLKSQDLIAEAEQELEETRNSLHEETEAWRGKIMQVDEAIETTSRQLQVLRHYKDKEYPVKQVRIEQLKETLEDVRASQVARREELEIQIAEERDHYDQHIRALRADLQARATEVYMHIAIVQHSFRDCCQIVSIIPSYPCPGGVLWGYNYCVW